MPKFINQPLKRIRFFHCGKIFALNVFNKGNLKRRLIIEILDDDRDFCQLRQLCGTPATLAGDGTRNTDIPRNSGEAPNGNRAGSQ